MASGSQKTKLIYLYRILAEHTDESHGITMEDIIAKLDAYGIVAERKALYSDIDLLEQLGYKIEKEKGDKFYYKLVTRDFSLTELKILVDAVQASKFLTQRRSQDLIRKLEQLTSIHHKSELQRQVFVMDRVRSKNEEIIDAIDCIHSAINHNQQIEFRYYTWTAKKSYELKKKRYQISPWYLIWNNQNYYMVGYDAEAGITKHYRVDRMSTPKVVCQAREGAEELGQLSVPEYTKKHFGMFGGEERQVTLRIPENLCSVMVDRFGDSLSMRPDLDCAGYAIVHVKVAYSQQFIGWLTGLPDVELLAPEDVRNDLYQLGLELAKRYQPKQDES